MRLGGPGGQVEGQLINETASLPLAETVVFLAIIYFELFVEENVFHSKKKSTINFHKHRKIRSGIQPPPPDNNNNNCSPFPNYSEGFHPPLTGMFS